MQILAGELEFLVQVVDALLGIPTHVIAQRLLLLVFAGAGLMFQDEYRQERHLALAGRQREEAHVDQALRLAFVAQVDVVVIDLLPVMQRLLHPGGERNGQVTVGELAGIAQHLACGEAQVVVCVAHDMQQFHLFVEHHGEGQVIAADALQQPLADALLFRRAVCVAARVGLRPGRMVASAGAEVDGGGGKHVPTLLAARMVEPPLVVQRLEVFGHVAGRFTGAEKQDAAGIE